jgi:hypothetical protein
MHLLFGAAAQVEHGMFVLASVLTLCCNSCCPALPCGLRRSVVKSISTPWTRCSRAAHAGVPGSWHQLLRQSRQLQPSVGVQSWPLPWYRHCRPTVHEQVPAGTRC